MSSGSTAVIVDYAIETAVGAVDVNPNIQSVHVGDMIRWHIDEGIARIAFADDRAVQFVREIAQPNSPAEAIAQTQGIYHHVISVWRDQRAPASAIAVLIVEP